MQLTKYTHACIALQRPGARLLIDPGVWSEPGVYEGVAAVLLTHEHVDHVDADGLRALVRRDSAARIYAPEPVRAQLEDLGDAVVTLSVGAVVDIAGFSVRCVGGMHADIVDGLPGCVNLGYVVDDLVYHPGDSFFVPQGAVPTLLVPTGGPWMKLAEAIAFIRTVQPERAVSIHDAVTSARGEPVIDRWIGDRCDTAYSRLPLGSSIEL